MKYATIFFAFFFLSIAQSYAQLSVDIGGTVSGGNRMDIQGSSSPDGARDGYHGRRPLNTEVESDVDEDALPGMSTLELEEVLKAIDTSLSDCNLLGQKIKNKMFAARGSGRKIHPDWLEYYGDCLAQREENHAEVESEVESRDDDTLLARSTDLERSIEEAFRQAESIEGDYNFN